MFGGVSAERTLFSRLDLGGVERIKTGDWGVSFLFVSASWDLAVGMCAFFLSGGREFFLGIIHCANGEDRMWVGHHDGLFRGKKETK